MTVRAMAQTGERPAVEPRRVLVVEDDLGTRLAISRYLASKGLVVIAEELGRAAMARLGQEPFDVLVLDLKLPDITGLDVLEHAAAAAPLLRVLIITGRETPSVPLAHLALTKPFSLESLHAAVQRLIDHAAPSA